MGRPWNGPIGFPVSARYASHSLPLSRAFSKKISVRGLIWRAEVRQDGVAGVTTHQLVGNGSSLAKSRGHLKGCQLARGHGMDECGGVVVLGEMTIPVSKEISLLEESEGADGGIPVSL